MCFHVKKTFYSTFFFLYNIRRIRKFLSNEVTETLVHALITSRRDYCYNLFHGLPESVISMLQRVQNACVGLYVVYLNPAKLRRSYCPKSVALAARQNAD